MSRHSSPELSCYIKKSVPSSELQRLEGVGFCPLASGSKGNCLYFGSSQTKLLIDAGLSAKATEERLQQIGISPQQIDAILITHEHIDHVRGLEILSNRWRIPIFTNGDTAKALLSSFKERPRLKIFSTGERFEFGDVEITPFSVQHDAVDPVAFVLKTEKMKVGVCTDLGWVTSLVIEQLKRCDYLYVEANHQPEMVHACARPLLYKQRVLSRQGHLSNEECVRLIEAIFHPDLKHIYLAHLSSECNSHELALQMVQKKLNDLQASTGVSIAFQDRVSKAMSLDTDL